MTVTETDLLNNFLNTKPIRRYHIDGAETDKKGFKFDWVMGELSSPTESNRQVSPVTQILSILEASKYTGASIEELTDLCRRGKIGYSRTYTVPAVYSFTRNQLDNYLSRRAQIEYNKKHRQRKKQPA